MLARLNAPNRHEATSIGLHAKILLALRRLDDRLLARYRWLVDCIDQIRSEGSCPDVAPSQRLLPIETDLLASMPALQFDLDSLEQHWETTRQCASPLSGRSHADQLDALLDLAETYIARAEVLRRHCWLELCRLDPAEDHHKPWRHKRHADDAELCAQHISLECSLLPLDRGTASSAATRIHTAPDMAKRAHFGHCLGSVLRPTDFVYHLSENNWNIVLTRMKPELIGPIMRRLVSAVASNPMVDNLGEQVFFKLMFNQESTVSGEGLARCLLHNDGVLLRHVGVKNGTRRWRCPP